ncbi:PAS domain S-box-containing protein [Desulfacinum hydrothermale DSM 13146]|uniref:PAS domain S-box-containing protein n=2 Tax=Desulfacinum hydrothermale TaxID=109258 RepID=A0A1W1X2V1_9BACT|nr:PAS domain S-box-containing protein [Desulfacinum hydrothermale DSM 13146]
MKASPQFLESILDNLPEGVIGHDTRRRLIYFNRSAERITGYRREEVLGKDCHQAFSNPFCGPHCSFCDGAPEPWTGRRYPVRIVDKHGTAKDIEMSVTGMTDASGALVGVLAVFRERTSEAPSPDHLDEAESRWNMVGRDPRMLEVYRQIGLVAASDHPVHIHGETGTGKELVARAVHMESRRRQGPFVPVNCGALPEGVLESELFGHVKGAFTGAVRDKKGRFELADGGTLFLDEVAELPPTTQVKLLRVLQEKTFERVGGERSIRCDVRIISATNRDLAREVSRGRFRDDLYYRLKVLPLVLPTLRERRGDIPLLAEHFLGRAAGEISPSPRLTQKALEALLAYSWPGNVRELQNALHYALLRASDGVIRRDDLPTEILQETAQSRRGPTPKLTPQAVQAALKETGGNKVRAARLLGVARATLYRFLSAHPDVS